MATAAATLVATATSASAATAAASAGLERVEKFIYLFLCCGTRLYYAADELKVATCQRMVEIHNYLHGSNLFYSTKNGRAVATHVPPHSDAQTRQP